MNIKKAIVKVFSANFIQIISSLIIGFVVPSVLSIEGYASLKTYTLYMTYVGVLHFGFVDGLYIKYGGKKLEEIDKEVLKGEHLFLIIFQLIISISFLIISLLLNNIILFLFAITILPIMLQSFFKSLYQATGKFDDYSKVIYVFTIIYMLLNILLAIVLRNTNYIFYCLTTFLANFISVIFAEIKLLSMLKGKKTIINKNIINNFKVGIFVLLGNLSVVGLFGIDKWFVKLFLSTSDFAYYSFAVSMLAIISTLVNSISITFYNYLFENNNREKINKLKEYLLLLGGFASLSFFVIVFIVEKYISKYIPSLDIIAITFAVFPYMFLINALYINLYKVNKDEKHYFKVVLSMLLVSIIYNIVVIKTINNTIAIAGATILTLITWVIYSTRDIGQVNADFKMYIYMISLTSSFLIVAHTLNWLHGGIVYLLIYCFLSITIYKDSFVYILKNGKALLKKDIIIKNK